LFKANAADPDPPPPPGNFDQLLIETAEYDEGFTKIVHAVQPVSRNLLSETPEEGKPVKDAGIRLGWDDEQILFGFAPAQRGSRRRAARRFRLRDRCARDRARAWQSVGNFE
jgi:hypothetical protein